MDMMDDNLFLPPMPFDQATTFNQQDTQPDPVDDPLNAMDPMDAIKWWSQDGLQIGFDPASNRTAAQAAGASPYERYGDPFDLATSDTPARDYDHSMYDYGDGYEEGEAAPGESNAA